MKKIIIITCFFSFSLFSHAQYLDKYVQSRGAEMMAEFAHPTNTFSSYNSSFTTYENYYILDLSYTDRNFSGYTIHTKIKLGKGLGSLYFNSIEVMQDNDDVSSFGALLLALSVVMEAAKENNPDEYNRALNQMRNYLGIQPENWNGADWALFLINFDYGCRCLGDD